jgi:hypothetical protein
MKCGTRIKASLFNVIKELNIPFFRAGITMSAFLLFLDRASLCCAHYTNISHILCALSGTASYICSALPHIPYVNPLVLQTFLIIEGPSREFKYDVRLISILWFVLDVTKRFSFVR